MRHNDLTTDLGQRERSSNYRTSAHNDLMGGLGQRECIVVNYRTVVTEHCALSVLDLGQRDHCSHYCPVVNYNALSLS